jgi:hypothetical protein
MTAQLSTAMHLRNIAYALRTRVMDPDQAAAALEMLAKNIGDDSIVTPGGKS